MLFRPPAEHRLEAIHTLLVVLNGEADDYRLAARASLHGQPPSAALMDAAARARTGLTELLTDLDATFETLGPGHADFGRLLQLQGTAMSLLESIETSLDILDRFEPVDGPPPGSIGGRADATAGTALA